MDRDELLPADIADKVQIALISHVYKQMKVGLVTSFFCACIVGVGLYAGVTNNGMLYTWFSFYVLITIVRLGMVYGFEYAKAPEENIILWSNLCVFGALLGGISWGFLGTFIFPDANMMEQMLIVLMLSGVTAGAVLLSSAVPSAAIAFVVSALLPLVISIALFKSYIYLIFDGALLLYITYAVILSLKSFKLIKNAILLRFENDALLATLADAKHNLEFVNAKLEHAATHDPLTQVANRILFDRRFKEAIHRADVNRTKVALLFIDFDDFKKINDDYGHRVGDQYLILTVGRFKKLLGSDKNVSRLGGDEFTVIVEDFHELSELESMAKELCYALGASMTIRNATVRSTVSIGISIYPNDGDEVETLLLYADKQMYKVKSEGGNNISFYHALNSANR